MRSRLAPNRRKWRIRQASPSVRRVGFYDGGRFARDGVVCVTINCQVGAVGSLYLGDGVANLGLLDPFTALE
jgi:carboxylesterase type B